MKENFETFDLDSTSPQTFSAMSDSAASERRHGAEPAEAEAVDHAAAEVDLEDSTSASLLLQSHDVTTREEDAEPVHEQTATGPRAMDTGDTSAAVLSSAEGQDRAAVDEKSSQEEILQPYQDDVEETLDVAAACDDDRPSEGPSRLESFGGTAGEDSQSSSADRACIDTEATRRLIDGVATQDVGDDYSQSRTVEEPSDWNVRHAASYTEEEVRKTVTEEEVRYPAEEELSYQDEVVTAVKQRDEEQLPGDAAEVQDDGKQKKFAEAVPQISISVCSSGNAEDDDELADVEDTSAAISAIEEDSLYKDEVEDGRDGVELSTDVACSDAEVLRTVHQAEPGQVADYHSDEDATSMVSHREEVTTTESLLTESSHIETEPREEPGLPTVEPATPEVERNLSQYDPEREKQAHEVAVSVAQERHESLAEAQQLHDAKLLCSSTESMVSSTASDWTVIDTREKADVTDTQQHRVDEPFTLTSSVAQTELAVGQESRHDVFEMRDEAFLGGLESTEDDVEEIDTVEDYLTATVTPTTDLLVMSTALESILEEEERTSSSQKTTSSSEKLEHEVSDSSKLVGSSPDVQQAAESPTFRAVGKFGGEKSSSDRDDASVSSSLAEFERLERELQEKGSSDSCSGGKGSSESAAAAALPESPQHKSATSLSSSLAEFERIEHEILGQSGSLELIAVDRRSHHTDSSSFSELERIEEMEKNGTAAEEQFRSSSGSLAEFEYIEHQLRLNEELESEALKVALMLEKSRASSAEKSPEVGSSQSDVRLSKEQIPETVESVSAEELAQPAASTDAQYPHYQDIVHIIREASKNVQTFQFGEQETSQISTETVSPGDGVTRLRQEETASELSDAETSTVPTAVTEVSTSAVSVSRTEHQVVVEHRDEIRAEQRAESTTLTQDFSDQLEPKTLRPSTTDEQNEEREVTDVVSSEELSKRVDESSEQRDDGDLMVLSTDSLAEDAMQLSTDSLQPDATMTTSTDSLELADVHGSSTSSATTLLAAEAEGRGLMERSVDSLESDSREPSGEWVTVYEADSSQERHDDEKSDAESTDSLEVALAAASGQRALGDDAGVSGSASFESFEPDSLQDDVEEEPTLVSSQSQDSLLVAGSATMPMDVSFGSSGAWSQSNVSSCTTLASSSDGEALTGSADVSAVSGSDAADRRLSEPSSGTPLAGWTDAGTRLPLSVDNAATTLLDSEGNIVLADVSDEPRTPRLDDAGVCLDNRQPETTDKLSGSSSPPKGTGHFTYEAQPGAAPAADVPPGMNE